jgi:hypothetical protein
MLALMMEAVSTYETKASFYQTTLRNIPEDSHLQDLVTLSLLVKTIIILLDIWQDSLDWRSANHKENYLLLL